MTSMTHRLPTQRRSTARVRGRKRAPSRHVRRSTRGFMERRVGVSALLTLVLLLSVGLVIGLLLVATLLHALAALGVHASSSGTGGGLARHLASWVP